MDNALVLAAATAALKGLLENGLAARGATEAIGGETLVTALPPDRLTTGSDEKAQLNLFVYQITQKGLAAGSRYGQDAAPPRARAPQQIEMHYLLSAYGAQDLHMEMLLGMCLDIFNEAPEADHDTVVRLLQTPSGALTPPARALLSRPESSARIAGIKIMLQVATLQDMLNLWSIFQTAYRPSALYKVVLELQDPA